MGLLAPLSANALGIGDIRLHSALNQSLNAEIPIVTSGGEDISEMKVSLASQEAFERAGIEKHYSLSKLRFKPLQKEDGSYVILVTSSDSIREPFLNFMIEVHWPQGRMQREFTVLLDPPASFQEADRSIEELPEQEVRQRTYTPPVQRQADIEPARTVPRSRPKPANIIETPPAPAETGPITGTQYGPIAKSETLWSIAKQFNQDASISQQKMLSALYKANPQAFYKSSINALKAGETITIPDRETIIRLTGAPSGPPSIRSGTGRLKAETPRRQEETASTSGEVTAGGQANLKLLAPTPAKSKEETAGSAAKGKTKEDQALEAAAQSVRHENEEIRRRLAEFEQQLSGMQRLLTLKDEQIAALQNAQKEATKQPPATAPSSQPQQPPVSTAIPTAQPAATAKPVVPPAPPSAEVAKPPLTSAQVKEEAPKPPAQTVLPSPEVTTAQQPPAPSIPKAEIQPTPPPKLPVSKPAPQPVRPAPPPAPPKEEPGFISDLLGQTSYLIAGASGFLVLTIITAAWIKRRRAAMIDEAESILTLSDREKTLQLKRTPIPLETSPSSISEQSTTARSSFLSEFTPSDFDALGGEMEEVDPISEADVYLAYGRYKQAEELIHSAIAQNPERDECKLKLLEIHYATENAQAFEKYAQELAPTHKESKPEFWEKVVEMGEELCPGSPLFGDESLPAIEKGKFESKPVSDENKYAAPAFDQQYLDEDVVEEEVSHPDTEVSKLSRLTDLKQDEVAQPNIAYDFFSAEEPKHELQSEFENIADLHPADNVLSFDKTQGVMDEEEPTELQNKTLDDILAELGVLSEATKHTSVHEGDEQHLQDRVIEYAFDVDDTPEEDIESNQYDEEPTDYLGLTEMDEQETKLDLAKAYFDMGDADSARVILEQVTEHGNDAQKEEAWSLLGSLAKKEVNSR